MTYSKHKDRNPQDTILTIQQILNDAELFPVMKWTNAEYQGVRSNRVELFPSHMGTNGKGTDELYATASGYAELMERIQNNILSLRNYVSIIEKTGISFRYAPDEQLRPVDEIVREENRLHEYIFENMGIKSFYEKVQLLLRLEESLANNESDMIRVIPFVDVDSGKIITVSPYLVIFCYGSNGMAAGNTMEEAMVQGLSEIFERYVQSRILKDGMVPPRIPDEYLKNYDFWPLIEAMREDTGYDIGLYDGSLGQGCPVVACIAIDRKRGTFGIKLGSHPSFAVAAERTLTEAMQGRERLKDFASLCMIGSRAEACGYHNFTNTCKTGNGVYPYELFIKKPDWEFVPWPTDEKSNGEFLRQMFALVKELGYHPLVRDASHLGFPACYILIPGMSDMYQISGLLLRSISTMMKVSDFSHRFPDLTEEEEEKLLTLIRFKENSIIENQLDSMLMKPVKGKRMQSCFVGAFLAYKLGKLDIAAHFFGLLYEFEQDEQEKTMLCARLAYIRALKKNLGHEEAAELLRHLFTPEAAEQVIGELSEPAQVMKRVFPQMKCFDCEHCELKDKECDPGEAEIMVKIYAAMDKRERVSQEDLLKKLHSMGL